MFMIKRNKLISIILVIVILLCTTSSIAFASNGPDIQAKSAILIDAATGTTLFEKNSHEKLEPASLTKIMTLLLAFEAIDSEQVKLTDKVKVSERAWKTGGSQVFLGQGEEQTLETLLKCIAVASANDASVAVAEYIGGSVDGFVKMMNDRAKALGMNDTHFINPHGLPDEGHVTSAYDIAIMARELVKHPKIFEWTTLWMDYLEHTDKPRDPTMLANTNKLLGKYEGLDGLKTGSHSSAGYCFAATAKRGDFRLISVVLNAPSTKQRFEDSVKLLDYGFGNFSSVKITEKNSVQKNVPVEKGLESKVDIVAAEELSLIMEKGTEQGITTKVEAPDILHAPLKKGDSVGKIIAEKNGEVIGEVNLVVAKDIPKAGIVDIVKKLISSWLSFSFM